MIARHRTAWTFAITSTALFMASLDNLVVTTALPSIRDHLHASLEGLQWTVNAYTLTFAVLLLTGAALGERYGRRRLFTIGLGLFTAGSAAAAMAPGIGALVAARAVQGVVLASVGLLGIVLGVVRGNAHGWTSATVLPPLVIGVLLVAAFIGWELRAREPMLPLHLFRSRGFAVTNLASLLMFFGMFGSIFLLAQFLPVVQPYTPLQAGPRA